MAMVVVCRGIMRQSAREYLADAVDLYNMISYSSLAVNPTLRGKRYPLPCLVLHVRSKRWCTIQVDASFPIVFLWGGSNRRYVTWCILHCLRRFRQSCSVLLARAVSLATPGALPSRTNPSAFRNVHSR